MSSQPLKISMKLKQGGLHLHNLPTKAKIAHTMSVAQNLSSLGVQVDNNMISIFNKKKIIYKRRCGPNHPN